MKKISILISILIISTLLLNGCGKKEPGVTKYIPSNVLYLEVGKISSTEKIEIKLISAERIRSYPWINLDTIQEVKEGKIYILIEIELKNIYSENMRCGEFYLVDDKGTRYIPGLYFGEDELEMFTELKPNEKIEGKFIFVIPETTENFKIEYDESIFD